MSDFCYGNLTIDRICAQAELMDRMMHVLGVDPIALRHDPAASWFAARLRCIDCPNVPECRQWLDLAEKENVDEPAKFCPNQSLFDSSAGKKASEL